MKNNKKNKAINGRVKAFWLLSLCILIALALVATCFVFFVKPSEQTAAVEEEVEVSEATQSVLASTLSSTRTVSILDKVNDGTLTNGSSVEFPYIASGGVVSGKWVTPTNGEYTVTLPKGSYTFQLWGAEGGYGSYGARLGGPGGYATAKLTLTETTTIYIFVGGKGGENLTSGSSGTAGNGVYQGGGYNGGGNWRGYNTNRGAGGGGATDIRIGGTTYDYRILVAGGGGGGPYGDGQSGKGAGGGVNGMDAEKNASGTWSNCPRGKGGTQTAAGGCVGTPYRSSADTSGYSAGSWGEGGKASGDPDSGGGGGGGWFGGGGGHVLGGGGGSGFAYVSNWASKYGGGKTVKQVRSAYAVADKYYVTNDSLLNGTQSIPSSADPTKTTVGQKGNGYARITLDKVNELPKAKTGVTPIEVGLRGSEDKLVEVVSSNIATDTESGSSVYFTNGTATNYDTLTDYNAATNTGFCIYLDDKCTIPATDYIDWLIDPTNAQRIKITNVKRYPRKGDYQCTTDGILPLYVKIRDSFGTVGKARGCSIISFSIKVDADAITVNKGILLNATADSDVYNDVYLGDSLNCEDYANASLTNIYNPKGDGNTARYTAMMRSPLRIYHGAGDDVTIKAEDILSGLPDYDMALFVINDDKDIRGADRLYGITQYDASSDPNKVTAYTSTGVSMVGYKQLTFRGYRANPAYQTLSLSVYAVEKANKKGANYQLPFVPAVQLEVVLKIDNTRPVLRDIGRNTISLKTLETKSDIDLNTYFYDADGPITSSTHRVLDVKIAEEEFLQVDKYGAVISMLDTDGKSYYNLFDRVNYPDRAALQYAVANGVFHSPSNVYRTGFSDSYITASGSPDAYVQYGINDGRLSLTGLRATRSMYSESRAGYSSLFSGDLGDIPDEDNCTALGNGKNPGHFYILINLQDLNDPDDTGIWLPLSLEVTNIAPTPLSQEHGMPGATTMPTASGSAGQVVYFTPMGITITNDVDSRTYPIGGYLNEEGTSIISSVSAIKPLASDPDNYLNENMLSGGKLNEMLTVISTAESIQNSIAANCASSNGLADGEYFTVEILPVYVRKDLFTGGRVDYTVLENTNDLLKSRTDRMDDFFYDEEVNGISYVVVRGIKITLHNWTHNRYMYAGLTVADSSGETVDIYVAINVNNEAPVSFTDATKVATVNYGPVGVDGVKISSTYTPARTENNNKTDPTITYNIPVGYSVAITPYDLLTDVNLTKCGVVYPEKGFTLNGITGSFSNYTLTQGGTDGDAFNGVFNGNNTTNGNYDYSSTAEGGYISQLKTTLNSLKATRSVSSYSDNNNFDTPTSGAANIDGLFFERKTDIANIDGFAFDPYKQSGVNDFSDLLISNDSYITAAYGSKLKLSDGNGGYDTFDLDFLIITATDRTPTGAYSEITLKVRDRMGAGGAGESYGVTQIKVRICVVNTTPRLVDSTTVYTITTGERSEDLPYGNFVTLNAKDIFEDREDPVDFLNFHTEIVPRYIVSAETVGGSTVDEYGNQYDGKYISVVVTPETMTITALNSTQRVKELVVTFYATDGRLPDYSTLSVKVRVINAPLKQVTEGFDKDATDANAQNNLWIINTKNTADIQTARYFVSSDAASDYLLSRTTADSPDGRVNSSQMRYIVSDTDILQGAVLSPGVVTESVSTGRSVAYINKTLADGGKIDRLKSVPYANSSTAKANDPVAIFVNYTKASANPEWNTAGGENSIAMFDIEYYVKIDGKYKTFKASELRQEPAVGEIDYLNHEDYAHLFFDEEGRWCVTDWALVIYPQNSFNVGNYLTMEISLRDETRYGGDSAGIGDAYDEDGDTPYDVLDHEVFTFMLFVKSIGIVTYDYYDAYGGYYVVADGADSQTVYLSTYDGKDGTAPTSLVEDTDSGSPYVYDADPIKNSALPSIYVKSVGDKKVIKASASQGDYDSRLKDMSNGAYDLTDAGVHSGRPFDLAEMEDLEKQFSSQIYDENDNPSQERAFRYTHTFEVSDRTIYVPMSYFALNINLVSLDNSNGASRGTYSYPVNSYIGYNTLSGNNTGVSNPYSRGTISNINTAIIISDGTPEGTYTGAKLNENPYVTIGAYEGVGSDGYKKSLTGEYFNRCLAVTTVSDVNSVDDGLGNVTEDGYVALSYADKTSNYADFVGNGHMMYLRGQESQLQENLFGLSITQKANTRASVSNLTISIKVCKCTYDGTPGSTGTKTNVSDLDNDTATVTFNLHLNNSPVTLDTDTVETYERIDDLEKYYFTNVTIPSNDTEGFKLLLSNEADAVDPENTKARRIGYVDDDKSDKAYFDPDSIRKISDLGENNSKYSRLLELANSTGASSSDLAAFKHVSVDNLAVTSIQRYLGGVSTVGDVSALASAGEYIPNDGIYGTQNEGYSDYFEVSFTDSNAGILIKPKAKTLINNGAITAAQSRNPATTSESYYAERGLKYVGGTKPYAYYPLRVIIFDSCGDGWSDGSYVCLEIRVNITDSAPTFANSLKADDDPSASPDDKMINISVPVGSTYTFPLTDAIVDKDLLRSADGTNSRIFWNYEYEELCKKQSPSKTELFKMDTGDYMVSPYQSFNASSCTNTFLINDWATFSDYRIADANQADVIVTMAYNTGSDTKISDISQADKRGSVRLTNDSIVIKVIRRTTAKKSGTTTAIKDFNINVKLSDSSGNSAPNLRIHVHVINQTPDARTQNIPTSIKMQVGDSFTVMTTPYDEFIDGNSSSYLASATYGRINSDQIVGNATNSMINYNGPDDSGKVNFSELTTENLRLPTTLNPNGGRYAIHDYDPNKDSKGHLGYIALATDDTPWTLRISDVICTGDYFKMYACSTIKNESDIGKEGVGSTYPLDYKFEAKAIVDNHPITFVISDGEENGGTLTVTLRVSVVSSKPRPNKTPDFDSSKLEKTDGGLYYTRNSANSAYVTGSYDLYMMSYNSQRKTENYTLEGGENITAYGEYTVRIKDIAWDPDTNDNQNIGLFMSDGVPLFEMTNDVNSPEAGLTKESDTVYYNKKFRITLIDYQSFTIRCLGYDTQNDWDTLSFRVRDAGNNVYGNSIPINLRITTLYSRMSNTLETSAAYTSPITGKNEPTPQVVKVKAYDVYDASDNEYSTYQFLKYFNVPESVDNNKVEPGIVDNDVLEVVGSLNYDVRIYALLEQDEEGNYKSLTPKQLSEMTFTDSNGNVVKDSLGNVVEGMFKISKGTGEFSLKDRTTDKNSTTAKYLIGGHYSTGGTYSSLIRDRGLKDYVEQFIGFEFGSDGVSLKLSPSKRLTDEDNRILLYVEVKKEIDNSRSVKPSSGMSTACGSLFYVEVEDSAPVANSDPSKFDATLKINESVTYKIFDPLDKEGSLFKDINEDDFVTVEPNGGYAANSKELDIFNINVDNNAGTITITVRHRVDQMDAHSNYKPIANVPLVIVGKDKNDKSASITLNISIENTDISLYENVLGDYRDNNPDSAVYGSGYVLERGENSHTYNLDVYTSLDVDPIKLDISRWIDDPDLLSQSTNYDSLRLESVDGINKTKYVVFGMANNTLDVVSDKASGGTIATIVPEFATVRDKTSADFGKPNVYDFRSITISAKSNMRDYTGTAFLRVLDRSGNADSENAGITFIITVHIINSAPTLKPGVSSKITVKRTGSDTQAIDKIVIDINDYVTDPNPTDAPEKAQDSSNTTHLRIVASYANNSIGNASTVQGDNVRTDIVDVIQPEGKYNQVCEITPLTGYYGKQEVIINIMDGARNDQTAKSITLTIVVQIDYNINDVPELKPINDAIRGMPYTVLVKDIVPEIENTMGMDPDTIEFFNPASDYVITRVYTTGSQADYIATGKDENGNCMFKPKKTTGDSTITLYVDFKHASDAENAAVSAITKSLPLTIKENPKPEIVPGFKNGYTFYSSGNYEFKLDQDGKVYLKPEDLFTDNVGDELKFVVGSASSSINSLVTATVKTPTSLEIVFKASGSAEITLQIMDSTEEPVTWTFRVTNIDLPEPSFWHSLQISFETKKVMWFSIIGGVVLLILLLIILLIVFKRRKRKREEIEAMLVSEMELEEQMLRLNASATAQLNSYGYLPPTVNVQDPGLMLGTGGVNSNGEKVLNLNPGAEGQGQTPPATSIPFNQQPAEQPGNAEASADDDGPQTYDTF